ncbi:spermidine synthase [Folsomia candida]|uniref:spermidine synthase n=1 Tax=Folsomia candida TaxID=158441 RepID=UPI000B8FD2FB|nr:spermidine synthase [Folsomia candida]XP_021956229.1 spermidine synthase [Folsomia candida]XP_035709651.1 spermidine synthase [Folsomia candida]XP_035709652.1 spermidine synthase [Folsomia candida]XP_035709653.1 spermidine synthase [Folsomia candida]
MDAFKEGWFTELSPMWEGQAFSMEVTSVLYQGQSKFQDVAVLDTKTYGKALALDGAIQCTEKDEFSYQEMMSFLPLTCHPNPKSVLIIGGGDGGVAREVSKFPTVEKIVQCEIDETVVEVSKKYLPFMAKGFESPKLTLNIGDGFKFMGEHEDEFDVIITDSSDPIGPAESLFGEKYYRLCDKALRPGGIICSQGENMWYHAPIIRSMMDFCKGIFPVVSYAYTCIPTYPGGQIGFLLCSKNEETKFEQPLRTFGEAELENFNLRYYTGEIHKSAFILPRFAVKALTGPVQ